MNGLPTAKTRPARYLRYTAWLVLFLSVVLLATYVGFNEYSRYTMRAMNCEKLSPKEFDKLLAEKLAEPMYAANPNEPSAPVTFKFNLEPALLSDTILIIESNNVERYVYRDQYQDEIVIQAGQDLLQGGPELLDGRRGYDSFTFVVLNKKMREICVDEHGAPFWQANKKVYIDFLPFRELDKIGLPVTFKVRIE